MTELAKEIKIKSIERQKKFIETQLLNVDENGNTAYPYVGQPYPEVINYFRDQGIKAEKVQSDLLTAANKGKPVYLFSVMERVTLTEEERVLTQKSYAGQSVEDDGDLSFDIPQEDDNDMPQDEDLPF